nr:hypothetical protein [Bordetella sp. LUAb4]
MSNPDKIDWTGILGDWKKIKPVLLADSFGKCGYCEAPTSAVAYGDVEHFRPKSVYWWLALCVDNYVFACQICNQMHKKDEFPISGKRLPAPRLPKVLPKTDRALRKLVGAISPDPATANEVELLTAWLIEEPDLLHPYLEDPEPLFAWKAIESNREVELVVPERASPRSRRAVDAAIKYLGLNRETLARQRYTVYASLKNSVRTWKAGDPQSLEHIYYLCESEQPFAGMCRYFARLAGAAI